MARDDFRTIILPIAYSLDAKLMAATFPDVGSGMFTTRLSATGAEPATHVISSGLIPIAFTDAVPVKKMAVDDKGATIITETKLGDAKVLSDVAVKTAAKYTQTEVQKILTAMDVSDQPPFEAMARLGLKIINPPDAMGVKK